jgi:hypothetical protein
MHDDGPDQRPQRDDPCRHGGYGGAPPHLTEQTPDGGLHRKSSLVPPWALKWAGSGTQIRVDMTHGKINITAAPLYIMSINIAVIG